MKRLDNLILAVPFLVLLSAIIPMPGTDVWYVQFLALIACTAVGSSLYIFKFNKWLGLMGIIAVFSSVYTANQNPKAIWLMYHFILCLLAVRCISQLSLDMRRKMIMALFFLVVVNTSWVVLQHLGKDFIFNYSKNINLDDPVGFSASPNQIGVFFATTGCLLAYFHPLGFLWAFLGLIGSKTTSALIGFTIAGLVYAFLEYRKHFERILFLAILSAGLFVLKFDVQAKEVYIERLDLAYQTVKAAVKGSFIANTSLAFSKEIEVPGERVIVETNPWFGFGFTNWAGAFIMAQRDYVLFKNKPWFARPQHFYEHVHNDPVEWFFETGRIGLFVLLGYIITLFLRVKRCLDSREVKMLACCVLAQLITSLGVYTVHTAVSGMLLVINLGLLEGYLKEALWEKSLIGRKEGKFPATSEGRPSTSVAGEARQFTPAGV